MNPTRQAEPVLVAKDIVKKYPGTLALDSVNYAVRRGQVNVLIGENGAGKSTLVKIMAGVEEPASGTLYLDGVPIRLTSTRDADRLGIRMIHQELNLLPNMSVVDNIFIARERARYGMIDRVAEESAACELLERLEEKIDPRATVGDLPLGQQQVVEIAKAISCDVRVLIMDEPTSALSASEIRVLFRLIRDLKTRGISIVYISHRLEELLSIGDLITVLRDGRVVAGAPAASLDAAWIIEKMTGRTSGRQAPPAEPAGSEILLDVRSLELQQPGTGTAADAISFQVASGEIVGIYGLMGAGRTELLETLIGLRGHEGGSILLEEKEIGDLPLPERISRGLVLVPEDRQQSGLIPTLSVRENMTLARLRGLYLIPRREREAAMELVQAVRIRTGDIEQPVTSLSGGNQQKVVLSRFLMTQPKVFLLDEPTRGVDVGARMEIFEIIRGLAARGMGIVFSSSELKEIRSLASRVLVMAGSRITADLTGSEITDEALVTASMPKTAPREKPHATA